MKYDLSSFDTGSFESLIQGICQNVFGVTFKVYGSGPDGQREGAYQGKWSIKPLEQSGDGYCVIQAKYKNAMTKDEDWNWLHGKLKEELDGFRRKKKAGDKQIPDYYFFFTNVILTPVKDTGLKDKADNFVKQYRDVIPHVYVFGYDEICCFLDNNRELRETYTCFLLPSDVLAELYKQVKGIENKVVDALFYFLDYEFQNDLYSKMEQAGLVTQDKPELHKVFIDLGITRNVTDFDSSDMFINSILQLSKKNYGEYRDEGKDKKENKIVLIGNAGQGKSTLCQYLMQVYRAELLAGVPCCSQKEQVKQFIIENNQTFRTGLD